MESRKPCPFSKAKHCINHISNVNFGNKPMISSTSLPPGSNELPRNACYTAEDSSLSKLTGENRTAWQPGGICARRLLPPLTQIITSWGSQAFSGRQKPGKREASRMEARRLLCIRIRGMNVWTKPRPTHGSPLCYQSSLPYQRDPAH